VRNRGCLISDDWIGPALTAAGRGQIAVYPIGGWWKYAKKYAKKRKQFEGPVPFSLLVSLRILGATNVDIYSTLQARLTQLVPIHVPTS
jgi:hypothetical protein